MTKKIRFLFEYLFHYLKKYIIVIIVSAVFGSLIYLEKNFLNRIYQALQPHNQEIGIEGLYQIQKLPTSVTNLISYGLTTISENDKATKSPIVENLTFRNSDQTYVFTFNNNLTWHNGKTFSANDISFDLPGVSLTYKSPQILEIKTKNAFSPLLSYLNRPLFLKGSLIGLGDYQVTKTVFQDGYVKIISLKPLNKNQEKLTFRFYPNTDDLINGFKLGEVNEITTESQTSQFDNWPNVKITQQISTVKYLAVFLNTKKLSSKQLRQAIAYATPKSTDKNNRCLGPISPNSWAYNSQIKEYNQNPTRAKELFEKNSISEINLIVTDPKLLNRADSIKKAWEEILDLKINLSVENKQIDLNNYDAILAYGSIPNDPDQYLFWHSTQSTNITHLNNSRIDKLLEEGRQIQNQVERKNTYYDFQRFLLEESPAIFLDFPTTYTISRLK